MPWIRSLFLIPGILKYRWCDKIHSIHWSYDSTRKLWRNLCDQYFNHFNIIQGLHMLADSEEEEYEHIKAQESEKQYTRQNNRKNQ